jgi:hypothetical protein
MALKIYKALRILYEIVTYSIIADMVVVLSFLWGLFEWQYSPLISIVVTTILLAWITLIAVCVKFVLKAAKTD